VTGVGVEGAGGGIGVVARVCEFNPLILSLWARGGSEALDAVDTGEIALSSSGRPAPAPGDKREDMSMSPFERDGVCASEVSAGVGGTVAL